MNTPIALVISSFLLFFSANPVTSVAQVKKLPQSSERPIQREGAAEFVTKKQNHTARIIFESKLLDPRKHKIRESGGCVTIDGHLPLGTDCGMPQVEIASMRFFFDGKEIPIPRKLYSDCYSPPYFKTYSDRGWIDKYLNIKFSDDLRSVFLFLAAGDGAGVYDAIWVLRKDGTHTRFTNSGGDCSFLNFECTPNDK
jgi:hypothetical protein